MRFLFHLDLSLHAGAGKKIRILNSVTKQGACHLGNLGGLGRWSCSFCWTMLPPAGTCLIPRPRRTAFHIPWFMVRLPSGILRSTQTPAFGKKKEERKVKETEWASACTSLVAAWRLCPMRFSLFGHVAHVGVVWIKIAKFTCTFNVIQTKSDHP